MIASPFERMRLGKTHAGLCRSVASLPTCSRTTLDAQAAQPLFTGIRFQPRRSVRASAVIQSKYTADKRVSTVRSTAPPLLPPPPALQPVLSDAQHACWRHLLTCQQ